MKYKKKMHNINCQQKSGNLQNQLWDFIFFFFRNFNKKVLDTNTSAKILFKSI